MPEIVLTEEQVRVLEGATTPVVVRNPGGAAVGSLDPCEAEWIAEAKRRLAAGRGQGVPHEVVQARLAALQAEWERVGGFDREYARAFLARLRTEGGNG